MSRNSGVSLNRVSTKSDQDQNTILVTAAIAGVLSGFSGSSALASGKKGMVACMGINGCSGKGSCKTEANACKGQNSCKGKGIVMKNSEAQCKKAGGTVMAMSEKKMDTPAAAPAEAPAH